MTGFFPATVFWGQDGCPLNRCWKGKIMAFGGRWVWGEGQEHPPAFSYPSSLYKRGRFSTGSLNVNHRGVLFLHSSSVSLHFSWSWPQSEWRVFLLNVPSSNFYGRKNFLTGKNAKKKKSLKRSHKSFSGTLEKLRKIHNKAYIYICIYIYLHTNYIYTHSGTTRDWGRPWRQGTDGMTVSIYP